MIHSIEDVKALIVLPAPLDKCANCGEELILVLTEHCDDQVIFHRSQLELLIGSKVIALKNTIANNCPNKIEI